MRPQPAPDTSIPVVPVDVEFRHFASPSGNIACVITSSGDSELVERGVRCDIDKRDWSPPPRPAGCELDYGHGVVARCWGGSSVTLRWRHQQ